ncbi:MAG: M1 family aminopeptidase, partial [Fimbriiglobus sp.]
PEQERWRMAGVLKLGAAVVAVLLAAGGVAAAPAPVPTPAGLPRYHVDLTLCPTQERATFRLRVTWTNRHTKPTDRVVFNFYPHYRVPANEYLLLAKTLELLRLNPSAGIEKGGGHGRLERVRLVSGAAAGADPPDLTWNYREEQPTVLTVDLPHEVKGGESVTLELVGLVRLPEKQGRWGQWKGVTYFTNALPVVAYYDDAGWRETPFVPWHQPFHNEAGVYTAKLTVPAGQVVGCSAAVRSETDAGDGWKTVITEPFTGRDFAVTCSAEYREYTAGVKMPDGREVTVKCLAYPKHEFYAREILRIVGEALPVYSKWLGPYPYDQITVRESFFGWNGNECAGLILIDERVFAMPHLGVGYVEYLVSHEICHQWWYNLVGTNGYSETWLDEGAATYFTHRLLDRTKGRNNELLAWPDGAKWLPNIRRENYRFSAMYGSIRRNDMPPAAGDLPDFGHLYGLFSGAYDRGSKVFGMIEARLGEAAFLEFLRGFVKKYAFEVISGDILKAELEEFTGKPWGEFFDRWVYSTATTDWAVENVRTEPAAGPRAKPGRRVEVLVRQNGKLDEPTVVGFQLAAGDGYPVRIPIGPVNQPVRLAEYDAEIEPVGEHSAIVRVTLPADPVQVTVDPDRVLLDANPGDNQWKNPPRVSVTPIYSMLDETDLTADWDRWNLTAGPWVWGPSNIDPWYTRSTMLGVRAGAYRTQTFSGGVYAALRSDYRDLVVGADGVVDHWPDSNVQVGFNAEQRVGGPYLGTEGPEAAFRASVYGRYTLRRGSSLYLPPINFVDVFASYSDNFLPYARTFTPGAVRPGWTQLTGVHYRLNLYTPYWDPEQGHWFDATVAAGVADLGPALGTLQARAEYAHARKFPCGHGYWSDVKLAWRVVAQGALPDQGQYFALGGGTLFRGFDLAERQGSFLWVVNKELRFPVVKDSELDVADHTIGLRNLYIAGFADIGTVYVNGKSVDGTAVALGVGVRADIAVFSFIERATVRLDVAKTITAASPWQLWFGVQHPF